MKIKQRYTGILDLTTLIMIKIIQSVINFIYMKFIKLNDRSCPHTFEYQCKYFLRQNQSRPSVLEVEAAGHKADAA